MPIRKTRDTQIRGHIQPNAKQRKECQALINQIKFADLGRSAKTLYKSAGARLDMQGSTSDGGKNLQVQIGDDTAAAALLAKTVLAEKDATNQKGVANATISALQQSLDSGYVFKVTGSIP
jgi:hypothetical protein